MPQGSPKIGIWGLGRDGEAAVRHLLETQPEAALTLLSDNDAEKAPASLPGIPLLTGDAARTAISESAFDLIVKSPGVPIIRPEIAAGEAKGTRFTSGTNLWFEANAPQRTVAVTGTKGKSTTSLLLHHIAGAKGAKSQLLGNGGVPALTQKPGEDLTVLELSSYQCADLAHGPDFAVFTNLFPEHVPWHGSVEDYYAAKLRLASIDPKTRVFANARDKGLRERLAGLPDVTWFNGTSGYAETDSSLTFDGAPVQIRGTLPRGSHNIGNLAGAAAVAFELGLIDDPLALDLGTYGDLPHRLQLFDLPQGITAVDDSISTIPEATMAAFALFPDRRIHAILGGSDRGQDYRALARYLGERGDAHAYLLPHTGERIAQDLAREAPQIPAAVCADLVEAMERIKAAAQPGDVILLSPAAPSHSQYANFEERGRHFQSLLSATFSPA
ncbi:UDP-N-acetylmuramoyl-L-alanine--D-glutamate ligase [uncultured Erythrobacter sp.]|uniref:UDP-N-acetylmuramoyl-L-alanine--D-glutamate ligase n=1 Tax=uncultured Erythrobacter sp. TaxID=263913 RepID=UPI00261F86F0|nr:UDP-N-acetylmuramoyl-L-alanine--D-glutamate ligase [uncultured Erythrobacter sp.]